MTATDIDLSKIKLHESDTGSADVQIARLTARINHLTEHLSRHGKDHSSRRGLITLVAQRRKFLSYLEQKDQSRYKQILAALKLRK
jgi:small subunit ribosomal protein S15